MLKTPRNEALRKHIKNRQKPLNLTTTVKDVLLCIHEEIEIMNNQLESIRNPPPPPPPAVHMSEAKINFNAAQKRDS